MEEDVFSKYAITARETGNPTAAVEIFRYFSSHGNDDMTRTTRILVFP